MNIVLRDKILTIAKQVRYWTQEKADISKFNPVDLNGWCAIASAELHRALTNAHIKAEIRLRDREPCHAHVVVDDHVVDVTATQFYEFENETVLLLHCKEAECFDFYQAEHIFNSPTELRKHQVKSKWPKRQIAFAN